MYAISQANYLLGLLTELRIAVQPRTSVVNQPPWQYPIINRLPTIYSRSVAQSLLELSYRVSVHNREVNIGIRDPLKLDPPGFDVVIPIDCTYMFIDVNVLWFFYSKSLNMVVIVGTATYNTLLSIVDLSYFQVVPNITNYVPGMKVHGGFWELYARVQPALLTLLQKYIDADTQVVLTGLSLGGAITIIAAIDLYQRKLNSGVVIANPLHYSFASPRLFNTVGAKAYNKLKLASYQSHNGSDIIPVIPLPIMPISVISSQTEDFMHVENLNYFDDNLGTYYDNHITAYLNEYNVTLIS